MRVGRRGVVSRKSEGSRRGERRLEGLGETEKREKRKGKGIKLGELKKDGK